MLLVLRSAQIIGPIRAPKQLFASPNSSNIYTGKQQSANMFVGGGELQKFPFTRDNMLKFVLNSKKKKTLEQSNVW